MKACIAALLVFLGFQVNAETVDCKGTAYNKSVYVSTNPVSPYNQFVNRQCTGGGWPLVALDGDFYFVYGVDSQNDSVHPCEITGSMWELQLANRKDDGKILEYQLRFCRRNEKCEATRGLRIEKSSGQAAFFNILEDGRWLQVSQALTCTVGK